MKIFGRYVITFKCFWLCWHITSFEVLQHKETKRTEKTTKWQQPTTHSFLFRFHSLFSELAVKLKIINWKNKNAHICLNILLKLIWCWSVVAFILARIRMHSFRRFFAFLRAIGVRCFAYCLFFSSFIRSSYILIKYEQIMLFNRNTTSRATKWENRQSFGLSDRRKNTHRCIWGFQVNQIMRQWENNVFEGVYGTLNAQYSSIKLKLTLLLNVYMY